MALLNYTTTVDAERSIAEIQKMLTRFGVSAMMTEYEGQQVSAVSFKIMLDGKPMGFKLPCNWRAISVLFADPKYRRNARLRKGETWDDQAVRVAWRIIHDWVAAQLALVEVNMVTVPQVFLPYAITKDGRTLGEVVLSDPGRLLGSG